MKRTTFFGSAVLATSAVASTAKAETYYAKPEGSGSSCGVSSECSIVAAALKAQAGDTVILRDGNYGASYLSPQNSGNPGAWITFQADDHATPIFEGVTGTAVGSASAEYIKYIGIVSRHNTSSGFGNAWHDRCGATSNGNVHYINCIADGNQVNGIAHYCAGGLLIHQSIVAHNGNGPSSWSSGVNLYGVTGGTSSNLVQDSVSFDNVDTSSNHSDGSGFILDNHSAGATFINNLGFENGGSCIRLTRSSNSRLVNNTCYGNAKDPSARYNDEVTYSDAESQVGASLVNNLIVPTTPGKSAVGNAGSIVQSNNLTYGEASMFVSVPGAAHVDLNLTASAALAIDQGTRDDTPTTDLGLDPKCIKRGSFDGGPAWWTYVIDYEYIQAQGGVARCFRARTRTATPDVGAFEYDAIEEDDSAGMRGTGISDAGPDATISGTSGCATLARTSAATDPPRVTGCNSCPVGQRSGSSLVGWAIAGVLVLCRRRRL